MKVKVFSGVNWLISGMKLGASPEDMGYSLDSWVPLCVGKTKEEAIEKATQIKDLINEMEETT